MFQSRKGMSDMKRTIMLRKAFRFDDSADDLGRHFGGFVGSTVAP